MADTQEQAQAAAEIGAIAEQVRLLQERARTDAERDEKMAKLAERVEQLTTAATQSRAGRRAEFDVEDDFDKLRDVHSRGGDVATIKAMHSMKSNKAEVVELQESLDDLYTLGFLLCDRPHDPNALRETIRRSGHYQTVCNRNSLLRRVKDLDTTAGTDWIPVDFSASLHATVRIATQVAQLFDRVPMPTAIYNMPVEGSDAKQYLVAQGGAAANEVTEASKVTPSQGLTFPNRVLTAKKLGVRVVISTELNEEAIVPALPYIRDKKFVLAMAEGEERMVLNGSLAGTLDSDSAGSTDERRAWDGLRQVAKTANIATFAAATAGRIEIGDLRKLRTLMGKYALKPGEATLVCSPLGYTQLLGLTDANGTGLVTTVEKYGAAATLVTGEAGKIDGWPILVSGFVRDDMNRLGYYDGVTTDSTAILLVNRRQFIFGDYRQPTLKSKEIIDTDEIALVTLRRMAFMAWIPAEPAISYVYGVRTV